jgi:hypothetical protein
VLHCTDASRQTVETGQLSPFRDVPLYVGSSPSRCREDARTKVEECRAATMPFCREAKRSSLPEDKRGSGDPHWQIHRTPLTRPERRRMTALDENSLTK